MVVVGARVVVGAALEVVVSATVVVLGPVVVVSDDGLQAARATTRRAEVVTMRMAPS